MHNFEVDKIIMEAEEISLKSRAIIYRPSDNKIVLCNYAGIYLLPGGKIDKNENPLDAVKREVEEETGLVFNEKSYNFSFLYATAQRGYIERDLSVTTKALTEFVFFVNYDDLIAKKENALTEKEKSEKFSHFWITANDAISMIEASETDNPRAPLYEGPLLNILYKIKDAFSFNEDNEIIFINKITLKRNKILDKYRQNIVDLYGNDDIIYKLENIEPETEYLAMLNNDKIVAMIGVYMIDESSYYVDDISVMNECSEFGYISELTEYMSDYLNTWRLAKLVKPKTMIKTSK